jgi:hypothetical protein
MVDELDRLNAAERARLNRLELDAGSACAQCGRDLDDPAEPYCEDCAAIDADDLRALTEERIRDAEARSAPIDADNDLPSFPVQDNHRLEREVHALRRTLPRSGPCHCKPGIERDNCPNCEGSGIAVNWRAFHAQR